MSAFHSDKLFSAAQKAAIMTDWQYFITHGFRLEHFSQPLYEFLIYRCGFIAHYDRAQFWHHFFAVVDADLLRFLAQFGGPEKQSAEGFIPHWLNGLSRDLGQALCEALVPIYDTLCQILDEFVVEQYHHERKYELARMLREAEADYPNHDEADLLGQLAKLYDGMRPLSEYEVDLVLTEAHRVRLTQVLKPPLDDTRHPTVFELRQWLDHAEAVQPKKRQQSDEAPIESRNETGEDTPDLARIKARLEVSGTSDAFDADQVARRQRLQDPEFDHSVDTVAETQEVADDTS